MTYETFSEIVNRMQENDKRVSQIYKYGIDLTEFTDFYHVIITKFIKEVYGDIGYDWFSWFCYDNDYGQKKYEAWDGKGNLICQDLRGLYDYLEKQK